jgi:hypothetical protein
LYDLLWLCNQTLLVAGVACLVGNSELIACCCGAVAFSHVSWNFDIICYLLGLGMPFGTASYVLWYGFFFLFFFIFFLCFVDSSPGRPTTSYVEIVTTLHHVWMIPLLAYVLRTRWGKRFRFVHMLKGLNVQC